MLIVILGNMGSGKTTISRELAEQLKLPCLSVDQMRHDIFRPTPRLSKNMTEKEKESIIKMEMKWETKAKKRLIKECSKHKDFILETLGVSDIYSEILTKYKQKYPREQIVAFKLVAPLSELKKRVEKRAKTNGMVPVPQKWKCDWGNCYMDDKECLIFSLEWAHKLKSHFDPYIKYKWNSKQNSSKSIVKKIIKYLKK